MPRQIQKSLQECLSKIKIPNAQIQFQLRVGCKHPRTTSFAAEGGKETPSFAAEGGKETPSLAAEGGKEKEDDAATLSDIDKFLFENFRSLYQKEYEEEISKRNESKTAPFLLESPRLLDPPLPENLCRSDRFFVSTGSSGSLVVGKASSSSSTSAANESSTANDSSAPEDFIALLTYSPSPYEDFRRSMQEMVEARMEHNGKVDWEFLEELLFCYLDLNNKKSYRFILRAFVDLIVVLRENSDNTPATRHSWNGGDRQRQLK